MNGDGESDTRIVDGDSGVNSSRMEDVMTGGLEVPRPISDAMVQSAIDAAEQAGGFAREDSRADRERLFRAALGAAFAPLLARAVSAEAEVTRLRGLDAAQQQSRAVAAEGMVAELTARVAELEAERADMEAAFHDAMGYRPTGEGAVLVLALITRLQEAWRQGDERADRRLTLWGQVARVRALHASSHYCTSKPTRAWTTWYGPTQKCPTLRALDDVEVTSNSPDRLQVQVEAASGVGSRAASSPLDPDLTHPAWDEACRIGAAFHGETDHECWPPAPSPRVRHWVCPDCTAKWEPATVGTGSQVFGEGWERVDTGEQVMLETWRPDGPGEAS